MFSRAELIEQLEHSGTDVTELKTLVPPAQPVASSARPPVSVPVFQAVYSNQKLLVTCQAAPWNPSDYSISALLTWAANPETRNVYCSGYTMASNTAYPAGTSLQVNTYTQLFDPQQDGRSVIINYFGFITDKQGRSYYFEGSKTVSVG